MRTRSQPRIDLPGHHGNGSRPHSEYADDRQIEFTNHHGEPQAERHHPAISEDLKRAKRVATLRKLALQCGYCTPGFLITAIELLRESPNPSEHEVREALSGNLCRCTGYQAIVNAVLAVARKEQPVET